MESMDCIDSETYLDIPVPQFPMQRGKNMSSVRSISLVAAHARNSESSSRANVNPPLSFAFESVQPACALRSWRAPGQHKYERWHRVAKVTHIKNSQCSKVGKAYSANSQIASAEERKSKLGLGAPSHVLTSPDLRI